MSDGSALQRLAASAGIATAYHDIWGTRREVPETTVSALLQAMGLVDGQGNAQATLERWEALAWQRPLPPAVVRFEDEEAPGFVLRMPRPACTGALAWHAALDDGSRREDSLAIAPDPSLGGATVDGIEYAACRVALPGPWPPGYHELTWVRDGVVLAATRLIVAPRRCFAPPAASGHNRLWGPAVQLYAVRSERNWGIGDFTDLRCLLEQWGGLGAGIVGLNPLHALFPDQPEKASPYSPSSRLHRNVLYLDVEAVPEFAECERAAALVRGPEFQLRLQALRAAPLVDYAGVTAVKLHVLDLLYRQFCESGRSAERRAGFEAFRAREAAALERHALFEALQEHLRARDPKVWGWPAWPDLYRDPDGPAVAEFAAAHADRVGFFAWLQWLAEQQLEAVARRSDQLGLGVGLYLDLAVSAARGGAETWVGQGLFAPDVSVGAPPDDFSPRGQDWGLPPWVPAAIAEAAYEPFAALLRHAMRHAGALRIDHVMGLMRLYWVPANTGADAGGYVAYPFADLLGVLALESHRNRCMVVGEDLGTVPDEVRAAMQEFGVLSYRPLLFEKLPSGEFRAPDQYPAEALVAATTHDLPTLAAFWRGSDLVLRRELGAFPTERFREAQVVGRAQDRARLLLALEREGLLPEGATVNPVSLPEPTEEFLRSVQIFLARTPARLLMVQLEDALGVAEQVNLPGVDPGRYPSWRRKLPLTLEQCAREPRLLRLAAAIARERGRGRVPAPRRPPAAAAIPRATYRLQLHRGFTFRDATVLVPYLARLGVSHCYTSPFLMARPGSTHGYDVIDHGAFNPEIGGVEDFDAFTAALAEHGMGLVADIVPNHMGVMGSDNQWWLDVLENGPASVYAPFFDIDWLPLKFELHAKVLVPILGDRYGAVLERGELRLVFDPAEGSFSVWYYQHRFPVAPREYPRLLRHRFDALEVKLGGEDPNLRELASLITAFEHLPPRDVTDPERILERHRDRNLHKHRLARVVRKSPAVRQHVEDAVRDCKGMPGEPESFDRLHELLERQAFRLADWHSASDEINYRRFFDINDLAGLRMEDPRVFDATHPLILRLVAEGKVQGLRIDHPDGLNDPEGYFRRLQARAALALDRPAARTDGTVEPAIWMVVEKILAFHEPLPETWPVHGTTGYDFAKLVNSLFIAPGAAPRFERLFRRFTGQTEGFEEILYRCKRQIIKYALASELAVLANALNRISEQDRHTRDFTLNRLRQALAEVVAWLPVYRTYVVDGRISELDRRYIEWAVARARKRAQAEDTRIFDFVRGVLLLEGNPQGAHGEALRGFVQRFQQYTGPVMAKAMEDTAFYRYFPLASLNEVGGEPTRSTVSVKGFHAACQDRLRRWPHAMLAGSTHDSKRSEDVRARLNVLSEMPSAFRRIVMRWTRLAGSRRRLVDGEPAPTRADEYLLYQTLVGTWPATAAADAGYAQRIEAYMLKAAREAKLRTSWINRNAAYEEALCAFVRAVLDPEPRNALRAEIEAVSREVAGFGALNSLAQTLVRLTVPGVPDIYQGTELPDFSLVDPDNRREVDFALRERLLAGLEATEGGTARARGLLDRIHDGRAKLLVVWQALRLRREQPQLFAEGAYLPLAVSGNAAEHLVAFARRRGDAVAVTVVPRFVRMLTGGEYRLPLGEETWADCAIGLGPLGRGPLRNLVTGETLQPDEVPDGPLLRAGRVLRDFPVALLAGVAGASS